VLTQNTAWRNVELALERLRAAGVRMPRDVLSLPQRTLTRLIRPAGYYNQKAKKLRLIASFFQRPGALSATPPRREELLAIWGIGPETADSMLLYAFDQPAFVVDAYARRLLGRIGMLSGRESYAEVQEIFLRGPRRYPALFNEFHALMVEHAKQRCRPRPLCAGCPVVPCAWAASRRSGLPARAGRLTGRGSRPRRAPGGARGGRTGA
jgi:endonuclease-3 related protein